MINPSVASAKYQPVSINHATNLNLKVRTTSANSVRTKREQRTNNARTAYEQRANYARTTRELRANSVRTTRELRARTHPRTTRRARLGFSFEFGGGHTPLPLSKREGKVERETARVFYMRLSQVRLKIQFNSSVVSRRAWRVDFGVMEWGVMRAAIPLGCCVVGVVES